MFGYLGLLQEQKIQTSMNQTGNTDNSAKAEGFMDALRHDKAYLNAYEAPDTVTDH